MGWLSVVSMRKLVLLGMMVGGIALVALSQSGALVPSTPCNDTMYPPATCFAPFPWAVYTAFFSGIILLVAGSLLFLRGGNRRQDVRAENK